jgi:hypothetical protein
MAPGRSLAACGRQLHDDEKLEAAQQLGTLLAQLHALPLPGHQTRCVRGIETQSLYHVRGNPPLAPRTPERGESPRSDRDARGVGNGWPAGNQGAEPTGERQARESGEGEEGAANPRGLENGTEDRGESGESVQTLWQDGDGNVWTSTMGQVASEGRLMINSTSSITEPKHGLLAPKGSLSNGGATTGAADEQMKATSGRRNGGLLGCEVSAGGAEGLAEGVTWERRSWVPFLGFLALRRNEVLARLSSARVLPRAFTAALPEFIPAELAELVRGGVADYARDDAVDAGSPGCPCPEHLHLLSLPTRLYLSLSLSLSLCVCVCVCGHGSARTSVCAPICACLYVWLRACQHVAASMCKHYGMLLVTTQLSAHS